MPQDLNLKVTDVIERGILPSDVVPTNSLENGLKPVEDTLVKNGDLASSTVSSELSVSFIKPPLKKIVEERYVEFMKALQFETFDMIVETSNGDGMQFTVSYYYEKYISAEGSNHPVRRKRLVWEAINLRNSLPLSCSSTIFVRCDSDRLDVMKFLITGPADTPYMNGCFEFDVCFPTNYPSSPMWVSFRTTGKQKVSFNPNLYECGKVCLSLLNTWIGKPEERWNPKTSTFLQLLVSIQGLILVPDPWFNEPNFEEFRGTEFGTLSSNWYNLNLYRSTIRWAMVNQLKDPSPCFKSVIQAHFWIKRNEIFKQIDKWISDVEKDSFLPVKNKEKIVPDLKSLLKELYEEIAKLPPPPGLEDMQEDVSCLPNIIPPKPELSVKLQGEENVVQGNMGPKAGATGQEEKNRE